MTVPMAFPLTRGLGAVLGFLFVFTLAAAQARAATPVAKPPAEVPLAADPPAPARGVMDWLQRMQAASRERSYTGTFVVSAAVGDLSSARIWHACEGSVQLERIEALSGPPRSTFRRNDEILTFLPDVHVVRSEKRDNLAFFPGLTGAPDSQVGDFYDMRLPGRDRVAGFEADIVQLVPRDGLRFGYRIWSERRTGLVVKLQTTDAAGRAVEQSAFSELQIDVPVNTAALAQMMKPPPDYRVEYSEFERTTADAEGWALKKPVPGFRPVSCSRRSMGAAASRRTVQWTFSDGLASVSLFIEPYDEQRGAAERMQSLGATHMLTRRLPERTGPGWWLTVVGEVPPQTLDAFAQQLVRTR
ncbi:MAG: transcriptional regulator [Variovorax sp.]|nr:transcriptional regulator [Variovorax sp.]